MEVLLHRPKKKKKRNKANEKEKLPGNSNLHVSG